MPQPNYPEVDKAHELGFSNLAEFIMKTRDTVKDVFEQNRLIDEYINRYYNTSTGMYQTAFDKKILRGLKEQLYVRQINAKN